MPRVLLITTAYTPPASAGAARTSKLLTWLPKHNWQPTLLTLCWEGMSEGMERLPGDPDFVCRVPWQSQPMGCSRIKRADVISSGNLKESVRKFSKAEGILRFLKKLYQSIFVFPDGCSAWISPAVERGLELAKSKQFDLIYSSAAGPGVSAHFVASQLQRCLGLPWIHEYRDLWSGNPWSGDKAFFWRAWRERIWEYKFLRQSSRAVVMNEENASILAMRGPSDIRRHIVVVSNGFDPDEFAAGVQMPSGFPLRFCYTGSLYGGKRDLTGLFESMKKMIDQGIVARNELQFTYAGESSALVLSLATRVGIPDIINDCGVVSALTAKQLQQASQVLVLAEQADDNPWVMSNVPAKAYEYLGAARPVLALAHPTGAIAKLLEETEIGKTFRPDDSSGLVGYLNELTVAVRKKGQVDFTPNSMAVNRHSWMERSALLARLLDEVLQEKRAKTTV